MVFGFFKKNMVTIADTVYINGTVLTQDVDNPRVNAIPCKDGQIIYCGSNEVVHDWSDHTPALLSYNKTLCSLAL